jgi:hypothetical protein
MEMGLNQLVGVNLMKDLLQMVEKEEI